MRNYGIPKKLVILTRKIYEGTVCKVIHEGLLSESYEVKIGVRQGCLLSPFLFIMAVDYSMKETTIRRITTGVQMTPWRQMGEFAGNIALLSNTWDQMQRAGESCKVYWS